MTLAERAALLALYETEMRRDAWVPGLPAHRLSDVTRYHDAARREVLIMWHRFAAVDAETIVRRELDHFRGSGGFTWKVYADDAPENLPDVLMAAGMKLERGEVNALMVAPAEALARTPELPPGANIRILKSSADIDLLAAVWDAVWPGGSGDWVSVLADALAAHPDQLSILVVMLDGKPVSSGYIMRDPRGNFAYLGGGGVLEQHRGKGLYRALVHARATQARDANIRYLAIEAGPASRPILERLGFEPLTTLRFFSRDAP
ncbi:MAG: GNAT family N-acetyltransferase [Betaproteobacteria bacterium]|nr:GNAT family N-acetyltransferase [Betaproteobacteria bacterium]